MRPVTISVGPLATADDNGIAESQPVDGAFQLGLNGVLSDFSSDSIAPAQTLAGAGELALTDSRVYLAGNQYVVISAIDDESAVTFTIVGVAEGNVGVTETLYGPHAGFVVSQKQFSQIISISADGATSDDVEVGTWTAATLDQPRPVLLTFGADETGVDFAITGTDRYGNVITEIVGGNATSASTAQDFATVKSIFVNGALTANIIVGTSEIAGSDWVRFDDWAPNYISIQCVANGTVDYTVEYTLNDPNSPWDPVISSSVTWVTSDDPDVVGATGNATSNFIFAPAFARIKLNSGTGSVNATFLQSFGGI